MPEGNQENWFLAFAYDDYYPCGADGDFLGRFKTFSSAKAAAQRKNYNHAVVYDVNADKWHTF